MLRAIHGSVAATRLCYTDNYLANILSHAEMVEMNAWFVQRLQI